MDQPFFVKRTGRWCIKVTLPNGKRSQRVLGKTKAEALAKLKSESEEDSIPFASVAKQYSKWLQSRVRAGDVTEYWVRGATAIIDRFSAAYPGIAVHAIKPITVTTWTTNRPLAPDTIRTQIGNVQGCLNWAVSQGLIKSNPIRDYRKPGKRSRTVTISEELHNRMVANSSPDFVPLLVAAWETGCRPGELRSLQWSQISRDCQIAELLHHKTARKTGKPRILYFGPATSEWLKSNRRRAGFVFLNARGAPYTSNAVRQRFRRLRRLLSLTGVVAYSYRHSFAARAIKSGIDILSLAEMLGHSDTEMLVKRYAHLTKEKKHLMEKARLVNRKD